jgi:hypothetical protein
LFRTDSSFAITSTFSKKAATSGWSHFADRRAVPAVSGRRHDAARDIGRCRVECPLFVVFEELLRDREGTVVRLGDVDRALEDLREGIERRVPPEGDQRIELRPQVHHVREPRSQDRLDEVGRRPLGNQEVQVARDDEFEDLLPHLGGRRRELRREGREGPVHQIRDRDPEPPRFEDGEDPQRVTPEAVRVRGSGRDEAHSEAAAHHVDLVGDRRRGPHVRGRKVVGLSLRQIVLEHGLRDLGRLAGLRSVVPTHHPLQLRKLLDDAGRQVGLAEERRAAAILRLLGETEGGDELPDIGHPLDFFPVRSHVRLEKDFLQRLGAGEQGLLQVVPVVKLGIGEPGPEDPLVPGDDHRLVGNDHVRNEGEPREQVSLRILEDEIFLVVPHRGDENLPGKREVLLLEPPHHDDGVFHEVRHGLDERFVLHPRHADSLFGLPDPLADPPLPVFEVHEHPRLRKHSGIRLGRRELDGRGGEEPVTEGRPPRGDVAERKRQDLVPVQRDDPMDRAGEPHIEVGPPHGLLERNRGEEVGDDLRKDLLDRAGRLLANEAEVVAAIGRKHGKSGDVDPLGLRESKGRLRRLAGGIEPHALRRAHHGLFRRRLTVLEVADNVRKPPRGAVDVDLPEGEAGLFQRPLELLASEPKRRADESRRDFLAADLEQIVTFHRNPSSRVISWLAPRLSRRTCRAAESPFPRATGGTPPHRSAQGSGPGRYRRCAP